MPKRKPTRLADATERMALALEVANAIEILSHSADWIRDQDPEKSRTEQGQQNIHRANELRGFIRDNAATVAPIIQKEASDGTDA
jgi:hypothetical protein